MKILLHFVWVLLTQGKDPSQSLVSQVQAICKYSMNEFMVALKSVTGILIWSHLFGLQSRIKSNFYDLVY